MNLEILTQAIPKTDSCAHAKVEVVMYDEKTHIVYLECLDCKRDFTKYITEKEFDEIKNKISQERQLTSIE